jgi:hypothetical protein
MIILTAHLKYLRVFLQAPFFWLKLITPFFTPVTRKRQLQYFIAFCLYELWDIFLHPLLLPKTLYCKKDSNFFFAGKI